MKMNAKKFCRVLSSCAVLLSSDAIADGDSVTASATAEPISVDSGGSARKHWAERFESPADSEAHRADFARFKSECAVGVFIIGQASGMENVRPRAGFKWRKADEVKVRLARGERESVQILVAPNGVARSTATFSVDPDVIYRWRDEMADLIEAAVKY